MANSPITENIGVITFELSSEGKKLKDSYEVKSIRVVRDINKIPKATLVLYDGNPSNQKFEISDSKDLIPGKEIEIKVGYNSTIKSIFKGIVIKHGISIGNSGKPELEIEIKDKAIKMTVGRKNKYFKNKKDSDIISSLISEAGLTADVKATKTVHPMLIQHYCSDWDFMMTRVDLEGYLTIVKDGKIVVSEPKVSESPVLTVTYGTDLIRFNAEMNAESQLSNSKSSAWDITTQKIVEGAGVKPKVNAQGNLASDKLADVLKVSDFGLQSSVNLDSDSLKTWSNAQLLKSWLNKITGTASFQGSSEVEPGCIIEFKGVGDRFNGNAFISGVEHIVEDGQWVTTVTMGMPESWYSETPDIMAPHASGLIPGVDGLMIGKVQKLDSDPKNEFRILITLPTMQDDANGVWARLSNLYATDASGMFFIPEIDDEVIVGFINNDPRFPIILGSLYSSKIKPGNDKEGEEFNLTEDNFTKAILTKGQNRVEFNDDEKSITISTPGKNKIVLSDKEKSIIIQDEQDNKIELTKDGISLEDKNSNKIIMSSSGIEINSSKDLKLEASKNISITANANVEVKANKNVSVSGLDINNTAKSNFTAKGSLQSEISSSGKTTVKGTMVMIN